MSLDSAKGSDDFKQLSETCIARVPAVASKVAAAESLMAGPTATAVAIAEARVDRRESCVADGRNAVVGWCSTGTPGDEATLSRWAHRDGESKVEDGMGDEDGRSAFSVRNAPQRSCRISAGSIDQSCA